MKTQKTTGKVIHLWRFSNVGGGKNLEEEQLGYKYGTVVSLRQKPLDIQGAFAPRAGLEPATLRLRQLHSFHCGPDYLITLRSVVPQRGTPLSGRRALVGLIGELLIP